MKTLNCKTFCIFFIVILFVSILIFIPMDAIVYKSFTNINTEYLLTNISVQTPIIVIVLWIIHLTNTKLLSMHILLKILIQVLVTFFAVIAVISVGAHVEYAINGQYFSFKEELIFRINQSYFYIDLMEGLFILFISNMIYLYERKRQIELEKEKFKYARLKKQLNPHFLFNSLNNLAAMNYEHNQDEIADYVSSLADIYRYFIQNEQKDIITVREELDFVGKYVRILKYRFSENLIININVPEQYLNNNIMFLSLQLLLENAIKHNIIDAQNQLMINIDVQKDCITVSNNINAKDVVPAKKTKIGLNNLNERYGIYANKNIYVENNKNFFTVKIPMI